MKNAVLMTMAACLVAALPVDAAEKRVWVQKKTVEAPADGGWLGVMVAKTTTQRNDEPEQSELKIGHVFEGSPAEAAGFRSGDVLVAVEGQTVRETEEFVDAIRGRSAGDPVTATVLRDGRELTLTATLGNRPEKIDMGSVGGNSFVFKMAPDGEGHRLHFEGLPNITLDEEALKFGDAEIILKNVLECDDESPCVMQLGHSARPRLGVRVEPLTDQLAEYFGVDRGLLVTEVLPGTPAETSGLKAGDVITHVGSDEISTVSELRHSLAQIELPGTVRVEAVRKGRTRTFDAPLEAPEVGDAPTPFNMRFFPREHRDRRMKL